MPARLHAWYSLDDLSALADRKATLSGELRISELPRLRGLLHSDRDDRFSVSLTFDRGPHGSVGVDLVYEGRLELSCQRCLEPMEHTFREELACTIVERAAHAALVPQGREIVELEGDLFQAAAFVEDELIVSLPMIPRHASIDDCGALAQNLVALSPEQDSKPERPLLKGH
jgi:uncharacterized protein